MNIILGILAFFLFLVGYFFFLTWMLESSATKNSVTKYGKGNYKKFVREFKKYNWKIEYYHNGGTAFSDNENKSIIYDGVIKFYDKGMLLGIIDYIKVKIFLKIYISVIHRKIEERKEKITW